MIYQIKSLYIIKRIVLVVDPLPSVPAIHSWIMLSKAIVVEDFGRAPYRLKSSKSQLPLDDL